MPSTYPPLPNATSIRAFTFEVVPDSDQILGHFTIIDLDDPDHAEYEALSYAWGDPTPVAYISFPESGLKIGITRNLADGLPRLHRDGQKEMIWIDAICIDQATVTERNQQVRIMHRIYGNAALVKIWLGLDDDEQKLLETFELLKKWSNPFNDSSGGRETFRTMRNVRLAQLRAELSTSIGQEDSDFEATDKLLTHLLSKSWFSRLWVLQESWLGRGHLVLAGKTASMPYGNFGWGIFWFSRMRLEPNPRVLSFVRLLEWRVTSGILLLENLSRFLGCKASEPRDYVFAILSITDIPSSVSKYFVVDYEKLVWRVFVDATRGVIESTLSLHVLNSPHSTKQRDPSWFRDWSEPLSGFVDDRGYTHLPDLKAQIGAHVDAGELVLLGRRFTTVQHVRGSRIEDTVEVDMVIERIVSRYLWCREKAGEVALNWNGLRDLDASFSEIITGGAFALPDEYLAMFPDFDIDEYILAGFWHLLLVWAYQTISRKVDYDAEREGWAAGVLDENEGMLGLAKKLHLGDKVKEGDYARYCWITATATDSTIFFQTDDGLFGMTRGNVAVGDRLCVLYGGPRPFLLRRQNDTDTRWRFVGTTFVDKQRFNDPSYWEARKEEWFTLI